MDYNLIGIIGAIIVLAAFLLNQMNILRNNSVYYDFSNFFGSLLLLIYAVLTNSLPFLIVNSVWAVFSLKDVLIFLFKKFK